MSNTKYNNNIKYNNVNYMKKEENKQQVCIHSYSRNIQTYNHHKVFEGYCQSFRNYQPGKKFNKRNPNKIIIRVCNM